MLPISRSLNQKFHPYQGKATDRELSIFQSADRLTRSFTGQNATLLGQLPYFQSVDRLTKSFTEEAIAAATAIDILPISRSLNQKFHLKP